MRNGDPRANALPLRRASVLAKNVRVGDYVELGDGTARRVDHVYLDGADVELRSRKQDVGTIGNWAASDRVAIRRLKAPGP